MSYSRGTSWVASDGKHLEIEDNWQMMLDVLGKENAKGAQLIEHYALHTRIAADCRRSSRLRRSELQ